jgi:hypothetical protein
LAHTNDTSILRKEREKQKESGIDLLK